jgi:hypothetical protein
MQIWNSESGDSFAFKLKQLTPDFPGRPYNVGPVRVTTDATIVRNNHGPLHYSHGLSTFIHTGKYT